MDRHCAATVTVERRCGMGTERFLAEGAVMAARNCDADPLVGVAWEGGGTKIADWVGGTGYRLRLLGTPSLTAVLPKLLHPGVCRRRSIPQIDFYRNKSMLSRARVIHVHSTIDVFGL